MPIQVDHEQRRRDLAEVAADIVATGGADAATVRAVAAKAGFSTKVISHYFADKRALLLLTYRHAASQSHEISEASQPASGSNIAALLVSLLPIEPRMERNWRVWFSFWGLAIADAELAEEQRLRMHDFIARIASALHGDPAFSHLKPEDRQDHATRLYSVLVGVVMQAIFDPVGWPARRQIGIIEETLHGRSSSPPPHPF